MQQEAVMAVVHYDPAIDSFSNRLGNFVYYTSRSTRCVRRYVVPRNPRTEKQQAGRACFADAVRQWQELASYKKVQWNGKAMVRRISGYNLFISEHLTESREQGTAGFRSAFLSAPVKPLRLCFVPAKAGPGTCIDAVSSYTIRRESPS